MKLTLTDIANMAIDWCGGALSIQNIDDKTNPDALVCRRNLPIAIESELTKFEWSFACRTLPNPVAVTSEENHVDGYFCYPLPNDFSRLSMTFIGTTYPGATNEYSRSPAYFLRGNLLYSRVPLSVITYVSNDIPVSEWNILFADCVALNLAIRICGKICGKDANLPIIEALYSKKMKDARRLDLIQVDAGHPGANAMQTIGQIPGIMG